MKRAIILVCLFSIAFVSGSCSEVYYTIIETNYSYNQSNVSSNFSYYLENYLEECQIKQSFPPLPEKPKEKVLIIYKNSTIPCELNNNFPFDISVPFFHIGLDKDCADLNTYSYLFDIKEKEIIGIKIAPIFLLAFVLVIIKIIKLLKR